MQKIINKPCVPVALESSDVLEISGESNGWVWMKTTFLLHFWTFSMTSTPMFICLVEPFTLCLCNPIDISQTHSCSRFTVEIILCMICMCSLSESSTTKWEPCYHSPGLDLKWWRQHLSHFWISQIQDQLPPRQHSVHPLRPPVMWLSGTHSFVLENSRECLVALLVIDGEEVTRPHKFHNTLQWWFDVLTVISSGYTMWWESCCTLVTCCKFKLSSLPIDPNFLFSSFRLFHVCETCNNV